MMFRFGHATHPNWREALELVLVQLEGQLQLEQFASDQARSQRLGLIYVTDAFDLHLDTIIESLRLRTGFQSWFGGVAPGVCSTGVEYFQEPAIVVMLMELPPDSARLFSGKLPMPKPGSITASGRNALGTAIVHIDPLVEEIDHLLSDLNIKMGSAHIHGGLMGMGGYTHIAEEALNGGLSGVVFSENVPIEVRMTQGIQLVGTEHRITGVRGSFIEMLDDQPALDVLLQDLGLSPDAEDQNELDQAADMLARRFSHGLFVGLTERSVADSLDMMRFTANRPEPHQIRVRPVVGMDPDNNSLAIAEEFEVGDRLTFCTRDESSARADLIRMCAELRDELDATAPRINALQSAGFTGLAARRQPRGAVYIACNGRGASLFGNQGNELQLVREQLGDIPLVGFFANGEVFRGELYGYTGVLLLFF
ncbi:MAG: FIST C-terminal domain-containing protein [Limnobacter sp.]|nr:FIST C-terminal domain-containing protein [Limnobacter sp.]